MSRLEQALSALRTAARNDDVRRVELAWGAAIAAEWAHFVALGVFAYQTGGTSAVGIAGLVRLLPAAIVGPFAASLADRFRRERFLCVMALVGAGALVGSAVAAFVHQRILVFALASVVGLTATLFRPALQALLPSLASTAEELIAANGASSTIESLGTLIGPLAAGGLAAQLDVASVFVFGAVALLVAAFLLLRVKVEGRIDLVAEKDDGRPGRAVAAGFRVLAESPNARLVIGLMVAQSFVRGALNVLIVVAAFRVLHAGAGPVGYMTAAVGVGGLFGALAAMTIGARRLAVPFGLALVFWGAPIALIAPQPYLAVAIVLLAVVGAANSVEDVAGFTLLQRIVPDRILARVLGAVWGLAMGAIAIGSITVPAVVALLGPRASFVLFGAILPALTLITYRRLVDIDRTVAAPAVELELLDAVPMFAPLSLAAKERVAGALVAVSVHAGQAVISAGEAGDRFYIVESGELSIDGNGIHAAAGPADYFGEVALLRDVPRTATVRATVDSELYALRRDDFLAAVTGHAQAHAAGQAVAAARIARDAST